MFPVLLSNKYLYNNIKGLFLYHHINTIFNNMMIEKQALKHRKIILACECNPDGSQDSTCTDDGKCSCKPNFTGDKCDMCAEGFFNFQKCEGKNTNGSQPIVFTIYQSKPEIQLYFSHSRCLILILLLKQYILLYSFKDKIIYTISKHFIHDDSFSLAK